MTMMTVFYRITPRAYLREQRGLRSVRSREFELDLLLGSGCGKWIIWSICHSLFTW